jgi:DNA processing protein
MVGVVGTRTPTPRGAAVAARLSADLAEAGLTVVSGLARGTDTRAHEGALEVGGGTVAVLGCGLARMYPPENARLARDIAEGGALVSEFPMRTEPLPAFFPRRNRLISGLSAGVIVVEAAARSGALITAARALEQGREVFAVPGPVDEPMSVGPNRLIKAGAKLIEDVRDVLDELERPWGPFHASGRDVADTADGTAGRGDSHAAPQGRGTAEAATRSEGRAELSLRDRVLSLLSLEPVSADELADRLEAPVSAVLAVLMRLELVDEARPVAGGRFVLGERGARRALGRRS